MHIYIIPKIHTFFIQGKPTYEHYSASDISKRNRATYLRRQSYQVFTYLKSDCRNYFQNEIHTLFYKVYSR